VLLNNITYTEILVVIVTNYLLNSLPIMYVIIFLPDVLLVRGIDSLSILTFLLLLDLKLLSNVLICQTVCYIVLIRVVVSAPHGAFLSLTDIVLFLSALMCVLVTVSAK